MRGKESRRRKEESRTVTNEGTGNGMRKGNRKGRREVLKREGEG